MYWFLELLEELGIETDITISFAYIRLLAIVRLRNLKAGETGDLERYWRG